MTYISPNTTKFIKENLDSISESYQFSEGAWTNRAETLAQEILKTETPTIAVSSAGTGIMAVLAYFKERKGCNLMITQSNTCYAVPQIARMLGYEIAYVPCDTEDVFNMSATYLLDYMKDLRGRKAVVMMSHIGGWANKDSHLIKQICDKYNHFLVEDCAHSFAVCDKSGTRTGTFGSAGIFSFYATKFLQAGEGGIITTKDLDIHNYLLNFRKYNREQHHVILDRNSSERVMMYGNNIRISEYQALVLYASLLNWRGSLEIRIDNLKRVFHKIPSKSIMPNHLNLKDLTDIININGDLYHNLYKFIVKKDVGFDDWVTIEKVKLSGNVFNYSCPIIDSSMRYTYDALILHEAIFDYEIKNKTNYQSISTL